MDSLPNYSAVLLTCTGCTNEGMTAVEVISHQFFKLLDRIEQAVSNKVDAISLIGQSCRIYAMKNKFLCYRDAIWIELKDFISIELLDCIAKIFKCKEAQTILKFLLSRDLSAIIDMIHIKSNVIPTRQKCSAKAEVQKNKVTEKYIKILYTGSDASEKSCFINTFIGGKFHHRSIFQAIDSVSVKKLCFIRSLYQHVVWLEMNDDPQIIDLKWMLQLSIDVSCLRKPQAGNEPKPKQQNELNGIDSKTPEQCFHIPIEVLIIITTLLGTGGQPKYIHLLPTINMHSVINFVVHDFSKSPKDQMLIKCSKDGKHVFNPYHLKYSNMEMIKCLMSSINDSIESMSSQLGTILDMDNGLYFSCVDIIVEKPNCKTVIWKNEENGVLFPVNDITAGDDNKNDLIANYVQEIIHELDVYKLPIVCELFRSELQQAYTSTDEGCSSFKEQCSIAHLAMDMEDALKYLLLNPVLPDLCDHVINYHWWIGSSRCLTFKHFSNKIDLEYNGTKPILSKKLKEYFISSKIKAFRQRKHYTGDDFFIPYILPYQLLCNDELSQYSCLQYDLLPNKSYCLVVQLLLQLPKSLSYNIFSFKMFSLQATYYLSVIDKLSHLKMQIRHDYCQCPIYIYVQILELLVNALCKQLAFNRGKFQCSLHCQGRECDDYHNAELKTLIPALDYVLCRYGIIASTTFGNEHTIWLTEEVSIVEHDTSSIKLEHYHILSDFFRVIFQQAASGATEINRTSSSAAFTSNGFYCVECKKTVCMCTVKDHLIGEVEHDGTFKTQTNIVGRVADVLAPYAILNFLMLQLLFSNNHLTSLYFVNVLQPSNCLCMDFHWSAFDKKVIEKPVTKVNSSVIVDIVKKTCFSKTFCDFDQDIINCNISNTSLPCMVESSQFSMQLIDYYPHHTNWVTIFIALTLFSIILLSTVYDNFEVNVWVTEPSKPLNDARFQSIEECKTSCKLHGGKKFVSDSPSEIECILWDLNEIQNLQASQKTYYKFIIKEVFNQLAESTGGFNLLYNKYLEYKNLDFSFPKYSELPLQETLVGCKQIELEIHTESGKCEQESGVSNFSVLTFTNNGNKCLLSIPVAIGYQNLMAFSYDVFRPIDKDGDKPVSEPSNQQPFVNPMGHEVVASQGSSHNVGTSDITNKLRQDKSSNVKQSNITTKGRDDPVVIQPEGFPGAASNANFHSSHTKRNVVERDGRLPLHIEKNQKTTSSLDEKDGKLSLVSGDDQATPLLSVPTAYTNPAIGNVNTEPSHSVNHSFLGPQFVKGLPTEMKSMPTVGPQLSALYNKNFDYNVQSSKEEIRQKGNVRTTFYQHEVEQHAYNPLQIEKMTSSVNSAGNGKVQVKPLEIKPPEFKFETSKAANEFKPKPLPKRSCIVCGNKQYPLVNNLVSLPHMDHYFVKERTEIRPSYYLAKLVLRHQYEKRDDINEKTPDITAAQRSQAAVLAADSAVEKDGAVTERKHFPMNLNRTGFVVFSSDLTRFTGSIKYPLPSRKATAVKLGKGGNGFVFAIFHNGKEYAVKKTVYRPNEIRVHSQLAHQNLVNLDAVLIGEEHEKHRGKFYAFCFMTKCDMDFRSVISTKDHGCLKHLKLQLSNQRDIWQLVMVNVKYVLRSVLKALDYMHGQGLVHRDVKASNILLKMQCKCSQPLMCACPQKYMVKLGDFDSSTTVPGYGLKIEPHQMIRYASVLPLGTMGYRAPEVSLHLVISGPYEVLYTTAVDIWSFGCLLLNILIGKCGPLKQRGEASLLLSMQEQPYAESLYNQIIKIKELKKYYGDMPEMVDLVRKCLQVKVHCRPSAKQLLQLDILQCI